MEALARDQTTPPTVKRGDRQIWPFRRDHGAAGAATAAGRYRGLGLIDVVVVYNVDRLTRALADFAKMVEMFDAHGVSFVAVTQQFKYHHFDGALDAECVVVVRPVRT